MRIFEHIDNIQVQINPTLLDGGQIADVLEKSGMRKRDPVLVQKSLEKSDVVVVAVCEEQIVGVGHMVGDGAYYTTIWDLAVLPEYWGRGVGTSMVNAFLLEAKRQGLYMVCLAASVEKESFYEHSGFVRMENTNVLQRICTN